MLHELLRIIAENPVHDMRGLLEGLAAAGIQTDRGTVELAMLELEHKGYLRRSPQVVCSPGTGEPAAACGACALHCAGRPLVGWTLTDKALARR
jgi:hypothetical protein